MAPTHYILRLWEALMKDGVSIYLGCIRPPHQQHPLKARHVCYMSFTLHRISEQSPFSASTSRRLCLLLPATLQYRSWKALRQSHTPSVFSLFYAQTTHITYQYANQKRIFPFQNVEYIMAHVLNHWTPTTRSLRFFSLQKRFLCNLSYDTQ